MKKRSVLLYLGPLCLLSLLFSGVWSSWFFQDDFSWLYLNQELKVNGWWTMLAQPMAQGTFRPLSERAQFIGLNALFDMEVLPHHILAFLTQYANLLLLNSIARKVSGSIWTGFFAAAFWSLNCALALPLGWPSAYSQIMCGLFLLGALRLLIAYTETGDRRYKWAQWTVFLLGFGVQEFNVVYPAIALAYAALFARPYARGTLALFVPSAIFTVLHSLFAPKTSEGVYGLSVGLSIGPTLGRYSELAIWPQGAAEVFQLDKQWDTAITVVLWPVLAAMLFWCLWRRDKAAIFGGLLFVIILSPFLLLPNHISNYYLSVPTAGLGLLLACVFRNAWTSGILPRAAAAVFLIFHLGASAVTAWALTDFDQKQSEKGQMAFQAVSQISEKFPGKAIFMDGVDDDLFQNVFYHHAFRLAGAWHVYLTPETASKLQLVHGLTDFSGFIMPEQAMLYGLRNQTAVVFAMQGDAIRNITSLYIEKLQQTVATYPVPKNVKVGLRAFEYLLGPSWHLAESGYRWMPGRVVVSIGGPATTGEKLYIRGFCDGAKAPITFTVELEGNVLGRDVIERCDKPIELVFPLRARSPKLLLHFSVDRVFTLPPDVRELGIAVEEITVK